MLDHVLILKVIINGAELVLAGPLPPSKIEHEQLEHWENVAQWQGAPCGPKFSSCEKDALKRICRPMGSEHYCSCATPQTHLEFVQQLTVNRYAAYELNAQHMISQRAEEMACSKMKVSSCCENK